MDTTSSTALIASTCFLHRCNNWFLKVSAIRWAGKNRRNGRDRVGETRVGVNGHADADAGLMLDADALLPSAPDIDVDNSTA
jgi:hypothetical protein